MSTAMLILNDTSPWLNWPASTEGFPRATTDAGVPVAFDLAKPNWIATAMFTALATSAGATPTTVIGSLVGTGGSADNLISEDRTDAAVSMSWEDLFEQITEQQAKADAAEVLEGVDLIAEIKATLGVSITDLASVTGVSRQAVYDWIGGTKQISDANYDRLLELRQVCLEWRSRVTRPLGRLMRVKSKEGKTLLDLLGQEPLDRARIELHLGALASKAAEQDEVRKARKSKLAPLSEKDRYENALTHAIPATHS